MIEDKRTITLDGKSYLVEDLSDLAKHYVNQINSLQAEGATIQNKLQQCEVARQGFVAMLKEELAKDERSD